MNAKQLLLCILIFFGIHTIHLWSQTLTFSEANFITRNSAEVDVADVDADGINDILICADQQRWYKGPDFTNWYIKWWTLCCTSSGYERRWMA